MKKGGANIKKDRVEELFAQYYNQLLLYTYTLCRNKHVAQDVVSTAFFRALQTADDTVSDFRSWLYAVCRNEYFSLCRKKKRVQLSPFEEAIKTHGARTEDTHKTEQKPQSEENKSAA